MYPQILAKVVADRLQKVLPAIISPMQGAFVLKRRIFYGVLTRCRRLGVLCKLDLKKAYDQVDWDFLQYMMRH